MDIEDIAKAAIGGGSGTAALVFALSVSSFLLLYFGSAITAWFLTRELFPRMHLGAVVDERPLRPGQVRFEIRRSLGSIVIFGVFGLITFLAWRNGIVTVELQSTWYKVVVDLLFLLIWNEMHFYCVHRLLHTRWLYRHVHRIHHESVVPTPFSTYSFHWLEAVLLGSVMILPMFFLKFSAASLLALPVMSIFFNTIGHCNYNVFAKHPSIHSASQEHSLHHLRVAGNYGFYLPFLDIWAKTTLRKAAR